MPSRTTWVLGISCALLAGVLWMSPISWPLDDFVEYWAAGRLNAIGANPYDPAAMLQVERQAGWREAQPDMMYNPPWTLAIAMPARSLTVQRARSLCLPLQLFVILWSASELWLLYGGSQRASLRICALALLWMPTLAALRMGQASPLILLGITGFLWARSRGLDMIAGACFTLTLVKPQLVAVAWVPFLLWIVAGRRWQALAGAAVAFAGAAAVAWWPNHDVFGQFQQLMASAPPMQTFESPNLATLMRVALGVSNGWFQFVPTAIGAIAAGAWWYRRRSSWNWLDEMPPLVLLSCLLTSYGGWPFDLVVLLVPVIETARMAAVGTRRVRVAAGAAFAGVSGFALAMHALGAPQAAFIWMTPAVAIVCYLLNRRIWFWMPMNAAPTSAAVGA